jgi:type VI secretion system protein ImpH
MAIENRAATDALSGAAVEGEQPAFPDRDVLPPMASEPTSTSSSAGGREGTPWARLLEEVARAPEQYDFFQLLRRLQSLATDRPRIGQAQDPAKEPIRIGQDPSLAFAPAALSRLDLGREGRPPRLQVNFFGLLGPNGPLPLHLTEYARERLQHADDPTFSRFLDVFNHRMLLLMFRAWASAEPTVSHDRAESDRFTTYVGALAGLGLPALRDRDAFPDSAKLFYIGRLAGQTRNAEGLEAVIGDFFEMPTRVQQFVPDWLDLPPSERWRLGFGARLGASTTVGARVASRQSKFRVLLGPLNRGQFHRMLPGGKGLSTLTALVRSCVGDELRWDVRLSLHEKVDEPWLVSHARLGWTSWLGRPTEGQTRRDDLILDPQTEAARSPS